METKRSKIDEALAPPAADPAARREGAADKGRYAAMEAAAAELAYLKAAGTLPDGFDLEAACGDPDFWALVEELGAKAAVRVYQAERRAAGAEQNARARVDEQLKSRNALPRSTRSGIAASPRPDFDGMSSEAFRAYEQQLKRAASRGVRVPL